MSQKKTQTHSEELIQTDSDGFIFKVATISKKTLNEKFQEGKKSLQKNKVKVRMQEFAELHDGLFVKLTHKTTEDMYYAEVLSDVGHKPISYLYFPKSYIKSLELIPVIDGDK